MGMVCTRIKILATLAYGKKTCGMGMVCTRIKMARYMMERGVKAKNMAMEPTNFLAGGNTINKNMGARSSGGCTLEDG
jgi:hypothetical protein